MTGTKNKRSDRERKAAALSKLGEQIAKVSNRDLADVLLSEFDRRRLDSSGNVKGNPGLYMAAVESMLGLLEQEPASTIRASKGRVWVENTEARESLAMRERLAAVGLGARIQIKDQDVVGPIREIAPFVDVFAKKKRTRDTDESAQMLAKWLEARFGLVIDHGTVKAALAQPSRNGKIADIVIALGIIRLDGADGKLRNDVLRRVAQALA